MSEINAVNSTNSTIMILALGSIMVAIITAIKKNIIKCRGCGINCIQNIPPASPNNFDVESQQVQTVGNSILSTMTGSNKPLINIVSPKNKEENKNIIRRDSEPIKEENKKVKENKIKKSKSSFF